VNARFTIAYYIFNKEHLIGRIVECLRQFDGLPVIVFFDGCTDNSVAEFLKSRSSLRNCRVFVNGPYDLFETLCNNFILRLFRTECCVLFQDDLLPKKNKFLNLAERILDNEPNVGLIGFKDGYEMKMVNTYEEFISSPWSFSKARNRLLAPGEFVERTYVNRGPLCVTRRLIDRIGYLDERFRPLFWDDNDYSLRAKRAGFKNFVAYSEMDCLPEWGATRSGSKIPCKQIYLANAVRFGQKWNMPLENHPIWRILGAFCGSWWINSYYGLMRSIIHQKILEI
jgi:GT2 family glycosyltransferase